MKKFKKIMAVLVAAMMIMATMVPAWAAGDGEGPSAIDTIDITINTHMKNTSGTGKLPDANEAAEEYVAFRIFQATKDVIDKGNTTDPLITGQYELVANDAVYSNDVTYYKQISENPPEFVEDTTITDNTKLTEKKATTYVDKGASTIKGVAYFLPDTSNFIELATEDDTTKNPTKKYLTYTRVASNDGYNVTWKEGVPYTESNAKKLAEAIDSLITGNSTDGYKFKINTEKTLVRGNGNTGAAATGDAAPDFYVLLTSTPNTVIQNKVLIGYYLITSSLGSNLVLGTSDINITEKNSYPTVDKKITGTSYNGGETFGPTDIAHAQINDSVTFKLSAEIPDEANREFVLHDTMDSSLTLDVSSFKVYQVVDGSPVEKNSTEAKWIIEYKSGIPVTGSGSAPSGVTVADGQDDIVGASETFVVKFAADYISALSADTTFIVTYNAFLNEKAKLATDSTSEGAEKYNENKVNLTYSNYTTPDVAVKVYAHEFDLVKYYTNDSSVDTILKGAKFKLFRDVDVTNKGVYTEANAIEFEKKADNVYRVKSSYPSTAYSGGAVFTKVLESTTGQYNIEGLDYGTYYLLETEAPYGYIQLDRLVKVDIIPDPTTGTITGTKVEYDTKQTKSEDGVITYTMSAPQPYNANISSTTYSGGGVGVKNTAGALLPSTGGMGTTVLYIVGGMLVILAGAYLFFSRKRTA